MANGGAFVFIDQIDPDGTVNPRPYRRIAPVYRELARYEPYLVGEMVQDVAVYFSTASKVDLRDNGRDVLELTGYWPEIPHLSAAWPRPARCWRRTSRSGSSPSAASPTSPATAW